MKAPFRTPLKLILPLLIAIPSSAALAWPEKWSFQATEGGVIKFSSPDSVLAPQPLKLAELGIKEGQVLGALESELKAAPYLVITGLGSGQGAGGDRALYLVRADGGLKPQRLTYPGRLLDPNDRKVVYESRVFFGRCLLKQKYDAVVVFQKEHMDRKHGLQRSVYVAEATPTLLEERLLERGLPSIQMVEMRVRSKQCTEVSGRHRPFDMGYFSLRSRRGSDLSDDESEDEKRDALKKAEFDTE